MHKILKTILAALTLIGGCEPAYAAKLPIKKDESTNAVSETINFTGTVSIGGTALGALPLTHENGGLEADVSAYSGLVKISAGATSAVTVTAAGEALLDDASATDQRTTLGLGTIATQAANSVAITGGSISGITDLAVADGGTGVSALSDLLGTSGQISVSGGTGRVIGGDVTLSIPAALDLGGNASLEIPNSTTTTVENAGEIAVDTNGDASSVTQGVIIYYDGTQQLQVFGADAYPTADGQHLAYSGSGNKMTWTTASTLSISQTVSFGDFTDNGDATGYVDLSSPLPAGAVPLAVIYAVSTGFTGDTTATVQAGVAGDLDRFASVTDQSVLAAATVGHGVAPDACDGINSAQTIRVTVTGAADFTGIAAGTMTVTLKYMP